MDIQLYVINKHTLVGKRGEPHGKTEITRYRAQGHAGSLAYRTPLPVPLPSARSCKRNALGIYPLCRPFWADWCAVDFCRRKSGAKAAIIPPSSQRRTISRRIAAAIFRNGRVALSGIWLPVFMSIIRLQKRT